MQNDETTMPAEVETRELTIEELNELAEKNAGMGVSDRAEDRIQAFVKVLHQLSPELNPREAAYVKNAAPGDIWIASQGLLIPGQEGFMFQQCSYQYFWIEWPSKTPSAGSYPLARHKTKPNGGHDNTIGQVEFDNGHVAIETRYHIGLVYYNDRPAFPAVLSYSSTGAAVSTHWTNQMWAKRTPKGGIEPSWRYLWRLTTVERSNEHGRWYLLVPSRNAEIMANPQQQSVGYKISGQIQNQQLQMAEQRAADDEIPF